MLSQCLRFSLALHGEKLRHDAVDACAPGVQDVGAEKEQTPEMVSFDRTTIGCRECGSRDAVLCSEEWSDGLHYADVNCPRCGASYVLGGERNE